MHVLIPKEIRKEALSFLLHSNIYFLFSLFVSPSVVETFSTILAQTHF